MPCRVVRNDSLFAKYLRVTRNELLPGSHSAKRAQSSSEGPYIPALMGYAVTLDEQAGIKTVRIKHGDTPHSRIKQPADPRIRRYSSPQMDMGANPTASNACSVRVSRRSENRRPVESRRLRDARLRTTPEKCSTDKPEIPVSGECRRLKRWHLTSRTVSREYAGFFVDEILYGIANGRPSQLKRLENNLLTAFRCDTPCRGSTTTHVTRKAKTTMQTTIGSNQ